MVNYIIDRMVIALHNYITFEDDVYNGELELLLEQLQLATGLNKEQALRKFYSEVNERKTAA